MSDNGGRELWFNFWATKYLHLKRGAFLCEMLEKSLRGRGGITVKNTHPNDDIIILEIEKFRKSK